MKCSGFFNEQYVSEKLMGKRVNISNEILISQGPGLLNFSKTQTGISNMSQCFFSSSHTKRNSRFQLYIPGLQNNPGYLNQKEFLKSYEGNLK